MRRAKKIKIGKKWIQGYCIPLQKKNFILLRGAKGYVMCGYLDLNTANMCADVAVRISGVSTLKEALQSEVQDVSLAAKRIGIYEGQPVKDVLKILA